ARRSVVEVFPEASACSAFRWKRGRRAEYNRPTALLCWVRMGRQYPVSARYRFRLLTQRKSLVKLDAGTRGLILELRSPEIAGKVRTTGSSHRDFLPPIGSTPYECPML